MVVPYTVNGVALEVVASYEYPGRYYLRMVGGGGGLYKDGYAGLRLHTGQRLLYGDSPEAIVELGRQFADQTKQLSEAELAELEVEGW